MNLQIEELLGKVTEFIRTEAKTETVIGTPFTLGEFDCVPVMKVGIGFGSAGGEGDDQKVKAKGAGGGAAGGVGLAPIGFLVSKDGDISFIATHSENGLSKAFEKVPDLIEKYLNLKKDEKETV